MSNASKILIVKENPGRLILDKFPHIDVDNKRYGQEVIFDVLLNYKMVGRARLGYRVPFLYKNLRDSQTYMVFNRPANYLRVKLSKEYGDKLAQETPMVYMLFEWVERDLVAFEQIFKEQWDSVIMSEPQQHQMQLSI